MTEFCCPMLEGYLTCEDVVIHYSPAMREFSIPVRDGGSSGILIRFCPWCGGQFPSSMRDQWFDMLESLGIDIGVDAVPPEFESEEWWRRANSDSP